MPLVRITGAYALPALGALGSAVHDALVETVGIPPDDRFQILDALEPAALVADPAFLGRDRRSAAIVEITLSSGRSNDQKRALYASIGARAAAAGFRRDDVMVVLRENTRVDWSFGGGVAQYVPEG